MYTLFGSAGSGSAAVEIALERTAAPYRIVTASTWEPASEVATLRERNPLQQIPTVQLDDGSVLTESAAILIHLGLVFPEARLLPADGSPRAQAIRGLVYIAANCYAAIGIIDYPERWCADIDDATRKRIIQGSRARLHHCWEVFADQFPAAPFFGGDRPGALDFFAVVVSKWAGTRAHVAKARPAFAATLAAIEAHPDVAPVFARHWPA